MDIAFNIYTALVIIGVFIVINWDGMLLHFVYRGYSFIYDYLNFNINAELSTEYSERPDTASARLFAYLCKPLFRCPYCMASVWTVVMYPINGKEFDWFLLADMLCTCGIVTVLFSAVNYFRGE